MLTNRHVFNRLLDFLEYINSNRPLPKDVPNYLWKNMVGEGTYKTARDLHKQDEIVDKAYFIVSGYMMLYNYDQEGRMLVFRICPPGNIVIRNSFLHQQRSGCYVHVCKGAVLKSFSYAPYKTACETIDDAEELALKTANFYEKEELLRNEQLSQTGETRVLNFYKAFKDLLPPGKIIKDAAISSFLNMSVKSLRRIRTKLLENSLL